MGARDLAIWSMAVGQTAGYVAQTFSFGALILALGDPATGAGLPRTVLAAGPTAGLLLAAVAAPYSGRLIDRGHGARLLAFGPLVSALGLALAAASGGHAAAWIAAFLLVGIGQATSQFETCFGFLTRTLGPDARRAIVRITLVGGFSTTIVFPIGTLLARHFGWQGALIAFALVQVLLTCPANAFGASVIQRTAPPRPARDAATVDKGRLRRLMRGAAFWQLAGILGLIWLNHAVLTNFTLPVLMNRGASHDLAVWLAALGGPAQIFGRLVLVLAGERMPLRPVTLVTLGGFILSSGALAFGVGVPALWVVYALVQGAAAGVATILRPLLAAEVFGHEGFGTIWGALSVAPLLAGAAAPVLGAFLLQWGGSGLLIAACLSMAAVALALGVSLSARMAAR